MYALDAKFKIYRHSPEWASYGKQIRLLYILNSADFDFDFDAEAEAAGVCSVVETLVSKSRRLVHRTVEFSACN